mmetsp:Transcript_385/g.1341  ORF Transcript_385/g.1341 Transcript_385/m.1341 type:complete len:224 (-) Transcript_385:98-769(-)
MLFQGRGGVYRPPHRLPGHADRPRRYRLGFLQARRRREQAQDVCLQFCAGHGQLVPLLASFKARPSVQPHLHRRLLLPFAGPLRLWPLGQRKAARRQGVFERVRGRRRRRQILRIRLEAGHRPPQPRHRRVRRAPRRNAAGRREIRVSKDPVHAEGNRLLRVTGRHCTAGEGRGDGHRRTPAPGASVNHTFCKTRGDHLKPADRREEQRDTRFKCEAPENASE